MAAAGPPDHFDLVPVFPALETERLVLREITDADAAWYLSHFSRPEIVTGTGFPAPADLGAALEELDRYITGLFAQRTGMRWGLVPRGGEALIGSAGFYGWRDDPEPAAVIGYDLAPAWWGRGLMAEALEAVVGYAFGVLGLRTLEAYVLTGNDRSCATLERLGFERAATLPDHGEDEHGVPHDEHRYVRRSPTGG